MFFPNSRAHLIFLFITNIRGYLVFISLPNEPFGQNYWQIELLSSAKLFICIKLPIFNTPLRIIFCFVYSLFIPQAFIVCESSLCYNYFKMAYIRNANYSQSYLNLLNFVLVYIIFLAFWYIWFISKQFIEESVTFKIITKSNPNCREIFGPFQMLALFAPARKNCCQIEGVNGDKK